MAKHKEFDKYASRLFGGALGKKGLKRGSLTCVDVDSPPPPIDVVVNIKNGDSKTESHASEDLSLSLPSSLSSTPVKKNHWKALHGLPEEDYSFEDMDTVSDTDLECFCVDHMKLCSSRLAVVEHRHCSEVIPHLKRSAKWSRKSSPDSGRGKMVRWHIYTIPKRANKTVDCFAIFIRLMHVRVFAK